MPKSDNSGFKQNHDKALGMDQKISRRDFLNSTLLASGGLLMSSLAPTQLLSEEDWTGYGGVGDYSRSNGNTYEIVQAGHRIRNGEFESLPDAIDTGEVHDCVIVGGGMSGLAAALFFVRQAGANRRCLVLDNHPIFGGEAKGNEFVVDGQRLMGHQGSAVFFVQYPHSFISGFYDSIGLKSPKLQYQTWAGTSREIPLSKTPYDMVGSEPASYGFYFGSKFGQNPGLWLTDPWGKKLEGAPISADARTELLKWRSGSEQPEKRPQYHGDEISRALDQITLEEHMMQRFGISRDTIRTYLSPVEGGGSGLGPDALSAYADYAADMLHPLDTEDGDQMFPRGNAGIARLMMKTLIPNSISGDHTVAAVCKGRVDFSALDHPSSAARVRLNSTAVWVQHDGDPEKCESVSVIYAQGNKVFRVKARTVVMAGGCWTTKHIVRDLPTEQREAYNQFYRSPCLMANVALRNWRFLYKLGISGFRWFEGIGNYAEVRKTALIGADSPTISPDSPIVLNLKILYAYPGMQIANQGHRGRSEMLSTPFSEYERRIRQQFTDMFARTGFDARRDIAGIILNRWGHAYLNPQPGFFFGKGGKPAPSDILRATPFGRIAFANTDLAGIMDHRSSILEARRAVGQLLDQVLKD
ncbi:MAG TPA: FAD/NAD(P)-binding protein [Terriglobales bacterium]|nr:FAD/NAD(P)-binding protein [Terriglobales bacterium]